MADTAMDEARNDWWRHERERRIDRARMRNSDDPARDVDEAAEAEDLIRYRRRMH